jgi:hypothetical protein
LILIGLRVDLEDDGVSRLNTLENLIGVNWLDEDRVMLKVLFLLFSELGREGLNSHWFGGNLLGVTSGEVGLGSDLNGSLNLGLFDLGWFSFVL